MTRRTLLFALLASALGSGLSAAEPFTPPIEEDSPDSKLAKIVLVANGPIHKPGEHEYLAGCAVLRNLLAQNGVFPVVVKEWPTKPTTFPGAKAIVFYGNGGGKQLTIQGDHPAELQKLADSGVGLVHLHQIIDYPVDYGDRARGWFGGCYEPKFSKRAHWVDTFAKFPDHPISRGVTPFTIDDGWLYQSRFVPGMRGVTPLLRTKDPKNAKNHGTAENADVVSWAYDRDGGGRSFVFTGAHLHNSFKEEGYRRFLVNGILWSAGVDVPTAGAKVDLDPATLSKYLEKK